MKIEEVERYLLKNNRYENIIFGKNAEPWHNQRFIQSLKWVEKYLKNDISVLELGSRSIFTNTLKNFYNINIEKNVDYDLRYEFPFENGKFDLILCMETIEHIKDQEDDEYLADFTGSGIKNMMSESYRVLKNGGKMFLTTPNVCSYKNFVNIFNNTHPFFFPLHHRELSINDIRNYLSESGFKNLKIQTVNVWNNHDLDTNLKNRVDEMINSFGASLENRDDCIFALCKK